MTSLRVVGVNVTNGGTGYGSAPTVAFATGSATATAVLSAPTPSAPITITALGDKRVLNHAYSGPNASTAPYNEKFVTRHYGFGSCALSNGACTQRRERQHRRRDGAGDVVERYVDYRQRSCDRTGRARFSSCAMPRRRSAENS